MFQRHKQIEPRIVKHREVMLMTMNIDVIGMTHHRAMAEHNAKPSKFRTIDSMGSHPASRYASIGSLS